jgi:hypothetical protein
MTLGALSQAWVATQKRRQVWTALASGPVQPTDTVTSPRKPSRLADVLRELRGPASGGDR